MDAATLLAEYRDEGDGLGFRVEYVRQSGIELRGLPRMHDGGTARSFAE